MEKTVHFASDNWAGAHPKIAESLARHAGGFAAAYGASELDKRVEQRFNEIFEREVAVFFVGTGTAANSLALASVNRPGGVSLVHREAHVIEDECGAPEYFTGGARLHPVDGALGRIDPTLLSRELKRFSPGFIHAGQPMAVSITQSTEVGTLYTAEEIRALADHAHERGMKLHLDGARLSNARPADRRPRPGRPADRIHAVRQPPAPRRLSQLRSAGPGMIRAWTGAVTPSAAHLSRLPEPS